MTDSKTKAPELKRESGNNIAISIGRHISLSSLITVIILTITGCSSSVVVTESQETQPETSTESLNKEVPEEHIEELNSEAADQSEIDRQNEVAERELEMRFQQEANNLTHLYISAQQLFYNGNSEQALIFIQQANDIRDNADIRAFKGSIYLSLGNREKFEENWRKALELDKNVPVPSTPSVQRELQNLGLIE